MISIYEAKTHKAFSDSGLQVFIYFSLIGGTPLAIIMIKIKKGGSTNESRNTNESQGRTWKTFY
jgi:hypothetical protein